MKKLQLALTALALAAGLAVLTPVFAMAAPADQVQAGVNSIGGDSAQNSVPLKKQIKTIVNVILYVLGAIAVLMVVVGAIRYVTSGGDSNQTKSAKDTIMYALIGLVVAVLAYAIVNFVLRSIIK